MRGVVFYRVFTDETRTKRCGVLAVFVSDETHKRALGIMGGVATAPGCTVTDQWLRAHCRRITEYRARVLRPELFDMLDPEEPPVSDELPSCWQNAI